MTPLYTDGTLCWHFVGTETDELSRDGDAHLALKFDGERSCLLRGTRVPAELLITYYAGSKIPVRALGSQ